MGLIHQPLFWIFYIKSDKLSLVSKKRDFWLCGFFGVFQGVMPLIGYFASSLLTKYNWFKYAIPIIGFSILMALGIKSIYSAIRKDDDNDYSGSLTIKLLIIQAIATSIDVEPNFQSHNNSNFNISKIY